MNKTEPTNKTHFCCSKHFLRTANFWWSSLQIKEEVQTKWMKEVA